MPLNDYPEIEILEVSDSSLGMLHSCNRKFEFRKILQSDRWEDSYAAGTGTAMHAGMQHYAVHKDIDKAIFEMLMHYPYEFTKTPYDQRSWQSCVGSMVAAMKFMESEMKGWELAHINNGTQVVPAIEVPFALVLEDVPFYPDGRTIKIKYIGYIDFILYNAFTDRYRVVDLKTTTTTADPSQQYKFADQCLPYGLVLEALLNHDFREGFDVLYWNNYIHPLEPKNELISFTKSEVDMQEWMAGFLDDIGIIRRSFQTKFFRRNSKACIAYGKPCRFFDLCESRDIQKIRQYLIFEENAQDLSGRTPRPKPWLEIQLEYAA